MDKNKLKLKWIIGTYKNSDNVLEEDILYEICKNFELHEKFSILKLKECIVFSISLEILNEFLECFIKKGFIIKHDSHKKILYSLEKNIWE